MKLRLGRKKDEASLRPLTEKEIQKRLYGAYQEESGGSLKDEIEAILAEPPRRKGKSFWREVVSSFSKAFAGLVKFSRKFLRKTAPGWAVSVLVVVLLFLGIHGLNEYRVKAMKASKPKVSFEIPVEKVAPRAAAPLVSPVVSLSPPAAVPTPPSLPPPFKPYVIQVCTYASQVDAERLAGKMKAVNLPAFVEPVSRVHGKTFYPVFLGRFETFQEAQAKLKEFRQKPVAQDFQDSFIRTL